MTKKLTALLMIIILCFGFSVPAFAANPTENPDCGIIDAEKLDEMFDRFASEKLVDPSLFGIGFYYSGTGDSYYYNGDSWYYSGSLYKLPNCMKLAEKVAAGELERDTVITNQYGSYPVSTLEEYSIVYSNNTTGHIVVEYLGGTYSGKSADQFIEYTSLDESYFPQDFFDVSYYSPRFMIEVLQTLYSEQERFPDIIDYMKLAMPEHYLKLYVTEYEVAQKYGSYVDNSNRNWSNAVGIIYTPQPIFVAIMTKNVGYYDSFIAEIARMLTDYAVELDEALPAYLEAQAAAAAAAAETPAPTPDTAEPETAQTDVQTEVSAAAPVSAPTVTPTPERGRADSSPLPLIIGLVLFIVLVLAVILLIVSRGRKKAKKRTVRKAAPVYDEYDDYEDEEYDEEPAEEAAEVDYRETAAAAAAPAAHVRSAGHRNSASAYRGKHEAR